MLNVIFALVLLGWRYESIIARTTYGALLFSLLDDLVWETALPFGSASGRDDFNVVDLELGGRRC